ncbi:unnamed protein product [Rotaria sordida]|uniref:Berberine/berberine-like domain-containing protein n=1 Tax=Rotaria sordida TaxID=392033 RepID=A0A819JQU5_9BILA|nr:unnamed protein product [Rotaria sordida]CAF3933161.1 unnamed protein product [Rotaria sordida]
MSQGGAYPHMASITPLFPVNIQVGWALAVHDNAFIAKIKSMTAAVLKAALDDGQDVGGPKQILYPNYALPDTPLEQLYGSNVSRLQSIRQAWDPNNVMNLTERFKL